MFLIPTSYQYDQNRILPRLPQKEFHIGAKLLGLYGNMFLVVSLLPLLPLRAQQKKLLYFLALPLISAALTHSPFASQILLLFRRLDDFGSNVEILYEGNAR